MMLFILWAYPTEEKMSFSRQQRHFLTLPLETSRATWNMCGRARRRCDFCFELITYVSVLTDGTLPLWDSSSSFTPPGSRRRSGGGLLCRVDISLPAFPCLDMEPVLLTWEANHREETYLGWGRDELTNHVSPFFASAVHWSAYSFGKHT